MGLFDLWRSTARPDEQLSLLRVVRTHLPADAPDADVKIIAAVAGLLGQVAYADRPYLAAEEARIRAALGGIPALGASGVEAICTTLRESIATVADVEAHAYAKYLAELADRDLRLHVLDLLLDVAAADDAVSVVEVNLLRRLTDVLGLTQADYNASQERHRDKLTTIRR